MVNELNESRVIGRGRSIHVHPKFVCRAAKALASLMRSREISCTSPIINQYYSEYWKQAYIVPLTFYITDTEH